MQIIQNLNLCLVSAVITVSVAPSEETDEPGEFIEDLAVDFTIQTDLDSVSAVASVVEADPKSFLDSTSAAEEFEILEIKECRVTRVDFTPVETDGCIVLLSQEV